MLHKHSGTFPVFVPPGSRRFPFLSRHIRLISQICLFTGVAVVAGSVLYASWPDLAPKIGFESKQKNLPQSPSILVSTMDAVPIYDLKMASGTGRAFFLNALGKVGCLDFNDGNHFRPKLSWIELDSNSDLIAQSPGQECLAISTFDGRVRLQFRDHPERNFALRRPRNCPINTMAFSPDGKLLAAGDSAASVHVWSTETGKPIATFPQSKHPISALCFAAPDRLYVGAGHHIELWQFSPRPNRPAEKLGFDIELNDICRNVCLTPDGLHLVATDFSGAISCWNCADRQLAWSRKLSSYICRAVSFSERGDHLVVSHETNAVEIVDLATGNSITEFEAQMNMVTAAFLDESHDLLYTASADGRIRVWSVSGEYVLSVVEPERGAL